MRLRGTVLEANPASPPVASVGEPHDREPGTTRQGERARSGGPAHVTFAVTLQRSEVTPNRGRRLEWHRRTRLW